MEKNRDYKIGELFHLELSVITEDPDQPRKHFNEEGLERLANSIKNHGVLQPVIVRVGKAGKITLVSGERRYKAAHKAGLETIPSIFTDDNPREIALIENSIREDLTVIEQAEAMQGLVDAFQYTHEALGNVIGKARSTVTEYLSVAKLPNNIKVECRNSREYALRDLKKIAVIKNKNRQKEEFKKYKARVKGTLKPGNPGGRRLPKSEIAIKTLNAFKGKLEKMSSFNADERIKIKPELLDLMKLIDSLLV